MKLRDYLCIPYRLEAVAQETADGNWVRRLAYPELTDFQATGQDVEQVFLEVERDRIATIIRRFGAGDPPPVPRPPLATADPEWWIAFLGLEPLPEGQLDQSLPPAPTN